MDVFMLFSAPFPSSLLLPSATIIQKEFWNPRDLLSDKSLKDASCVTLDKVFKPVPGVESVREGWEVFTWAACDQRAAIGNTELSDTQGAFLWASRVQTHSRVLAL